MYDRYFAFLEKCTDAKACTVLLRGGSKDVEGISKWPYLAVGQALEVIPRTLAQNCGANVIRLLTDLRTKHSSAGGSTFGVNGTTGEMADMTKLGIWEPYCVKSQTLKTSIESACLILRIDDVVSGTRKKKAGEN
eukprot:gene23485-31837_t